MNNPPTDESLRVILYRHRKWFGIVALGAAVATMLVQHFKPFPPGLSSAALRLFQIFFFAAAAGAAYFGFLYRPATSPEAIKASNTPEARDFWAEVRRRRFYCFATIPAWFVFGGPLFWFYLRFVPADKPMYAGVATLATWACVGYWTRWRVTSMKCFHCGQRAFDRPPFFMSRAKCCNCGTRHEAS